MCPISFYIPGGFILVMPRCMPLTEQEFEELDILNFHGYSRLNNKNSIEFNFKVPVEHKICSFGWHKDKIVAIDYGS